MEFNKGRKHVLLASGLVGLLTMPAHAAIKYWDTSSDTGLQGGSGKYSWDMGTTALWNTSSSGANPLTTFASGDTAYFTVAGSAVTLNVASTGVTALNLNFATGLGSGYTIGGTGTLTLTTTATVLTINESVTITANIALGNSQLWASGGGESLTVSGRVSGSYGITKLGAGTMTLSGLNTYTGQTLIGRADLFFNSIKNVGEGASALGAPTTAENGTIVLGMGAYGNYVPVLTYIGTENARSNRIIQLGSNRGGTISNNGTGTLALTSDMLATGLGDKTFTLGGTNTGDNTFAGAIVDTDTIAGNLTSLVKADAGTWILSGVNTYTGTTGVSGGTLKINGDNSAATGAVSVGSGATLAGNGSVGGSVTVASGGFLNGNSTYGGLVTVSGNHAPGDSAAQQTFSGGLSYAGTGLLEWELFSSTTGDPGTNYDQILVTGGELAIAEGATLSLFLNRTGSTVDIENDAFWRAAHTWTVIDYLVDGGHSSGSFTSLAWDPAYATYGNFSVASVDGDVQLSWTPVPEPSTLAGLAGLAVAGLGAWLWRRRSRV